MPPFKNFGMSTKRIFDDTYLYLREVNSKFLDKDHPVLIIDVNGDEYRHGTSI